MIQGWIWISIIPQIMKKPWNWRARSFRSWRQHKLRLFLCGCVLLGSVPAFSASEFWQRQSIYQVITDRFFDGDPSNNNADGNYDPKGHRGTSVHGGDFKGLEQKLDYIKSLGATAVWISPIVLNARGEFHGYAGRDFYKVDPHWGTLEDLRHMVQAAHARGLLVIDDVIVNHGGNLIDSADHDYGRFRHPPQGYQLRYRDPSVTYPPPFDLNATNPTLESLFHNSGLIHDYHDAAQVELGELSGLDDFRTESEYVRAKMAEIYEYWIQKADFDGFRIDTVKHVEMGFWQSWCPAVRAFAAGCGKTNFFMFGEVYDGSDAKCGSYLGSKAGGPFALDSVLDYPLYFKVNSVFARATGSTRLIEERYAGLSGNYEPAAQNQLVTFLDNHDQPRFLSAGNANNNQDRLRVALVFLYTSRGIPCLYYGTEQAFNGANDPYDREDMFAGQFEQGPSVGDNFNMAHPLFLWVARLNNFRRLYPALQTGTHVNLWIDPKGPGLLAYARRLELPVSKPTSQQATQEVIVVLNTANTAQTLPARPTAYAAGTRLANLLDPRETIVVGTSSRTPPITVPATAAKMFVAESSVLALDPVVIGISPAHDSMAAQTSSDACPIVVRFSKPMDTNAVEHAFSTEPSAHGSYAWSLSADRVTFTPEAPGITAKTIITVRIGAAAKDAQGRPLYAPFESRFKTGALPASN
jgi:alpha-amylase